VVGGDVAGGTGLGRYPANAPEGPGEAVAIMIGGIRISRFDHMPGDRVIGLNAILSQCGSIEVTNQSMAKAKAGKYQSFEAGQIGATSEDPGLTIQLNTTITLDGTDVFAIESFSGTNDTVSASLMLKLINRVKSLH
jgi:hypothetical protein